MEMDYTEETPLTKKQIVRGLIVSCAILLGIFSLFVRPEEIHSRPVAILFLCLVVVIPAITYFGFKKYVGININAWWYKKGTLKKNFFWGISGLFLTLILSFLIMFIFPSSFFSHPIIPNHSTTEDSTTIEEPLPISEDVSEVETASPLESSEKETTSLDPYHLFFIFAFIAIFVFVYAIFVSETVFRGFFQIVLTQYFGRSIGIILQGLLFGLFFSILSISKANHDMFLESFLLPPIYGISLGIVKDRTESILAPAITSMLFIFMGILLVGIIMSPSFFN